MIKNYITMMLNIKKGAGIALFAVALLGGTTVNAQVDARTSIKLQVEDGVLENQMNALDLGAEANFKTINPDWSSTFYKAPFTPMEGSEGGYVRFIEDGAKSTLTVEVAEEGDYPMTVKYGYGVDEQSFYNDGTAGYESVYYNGYMGTQVVYPDGTNSGEIFKEADGTIIQDDGRFNYTVGESGKGPEGTWKEVTFDKFIHFKAGTNKIEIWNYVFSPSMDWVVIGDLEFLLGNEDFDVNSFNLYPNPVTNGVVNIDLVDFSAKSLNYSIFTLDGRMVKSNNLEISNNKLNISVSDLNTGTYILKAEAGNKAFTQKLIVQ